MRKKICKIMDRINKKNFGTIIKGIVVFFLIVAVMSGCSSHKSVASLGDAVIYSNESVTTKAEFPGGWSEFNQYIRDNYRIYDLGGASQTGTGVGLYSFVVTSKGKVKKVRIEQEVEPKCDLEMVRIFKKMPKWEAATLNGKPVSVKIIHEVNYRTAADKMAGLDRAAYYPGGTEALDRALIGYCEGATGVEYVTFTITAEGKVINPTTRYNQNYGMARRAKILVRNLKWVPAFKDGKPVPSIRTVAVRFEDTGIARLPF